MANAEVQIREDGLNKIYDSGENAKFDIVFVHGLKGHPRKTWEVTHYDEDSGSVRSVFWPQELLPTTFPESRIFSFGYPTEFATFFAAPSSTKPVTHTSIDNNSTSLIKKLDAIRRETQTQNRPLFFIAHSLGGLVCANAILNPGGPEAGGWDVAAYTKGMIFLGTPFQGSQKVVWPKVAEKLASLFGDGSSQIIKDLDQKSVKLKQIGEDFQILLRTRNGPSRKQPPIEVACFFETKSTQIKTLLRTLNLGQIVTAESASLAGYKPIPINADHRAMSKFADSETTGYIDVTGVLKGMIERMNKKEADEGETAGGGSISGEFNHGNNVQQYQNYGIVAGHVLGTKENANHLNVSHTFHSSRDS